MGRVRPSTVVGRIVAMIASLLSTSWLYQHTVAEDMAPLTVFRTVYIQCILILVTFLYYFVLKLCSLVVCCWGGSVPRHRQRRAPDGSPLPPSSSEAFPAGMLMVRPVSVSDARLTIRNVWIFVFGLGLVFFITAYCFIGLNPVCFSFLGLAVSVLAVDELICPRRELSSHYIMSRALSLLLCALGLFLVTPPILSSVVSDFMVNVDVYTALFGMGFPFLSQLTLSIVRDHRVYTWRSVLEACEFGFPFTGFLGVFHLCVAYGQRQQADSDALSAFKRTPPSPLTTANHTLPLPAAYLDFRYWYHFNDSMVHNLVNTNGPFLTFYTLTPLFFVPACVCFTWCVLDGCAVDPLFAVVAVLCLQHSGLASPHPSGWEIAATVFCSLGLCVRIACEYRPVLSGNHSQIYSMQGDSPQLPYFTAWVRRQAGGGPTMQECEAETQELASDFPRRPREVGV